MLSQNTYGSVPSLAMQQPSSSRNQATEQHLRAQLELLQNHDADASGSTASDLRDSRGTLSHSPPPPPQESHGYQELAAASHEAASAMSKAGGESHIHPDLRGAAEHATEMMALDPPADHSPSENHQEPAHAAVATDSLSAGAQLAAIGESKKAKRELSQSKRAAQNRAAQRAFRQRKEGYIKKLEQQVREFGDLENTFKVMQSENYALRNYILHLQSRMLNSLGEYPPPPPNINLTQAVGPPPSLAAPHAPPHSAAAATAAPAPPAAAGPSQPQSAPEHAPQDIGVSSTPLEAVAQAVAGLAAHEELAQCEPHHQEHHEQLHHQHQSYPSPEYKQEPCEQAA
ncbi:hypothetical protein E4U30_004349 [Claviceps sp. LM220 group G6]|nr:hypothetical protein E4U30_004349 [Claviceps sp. LM220 group G6]